MTPRRRRDRRVSSCLSFNPVCFVRVCNADYHEIKLFIAEESAGDISYGVFILFLMLFCFSNFTNYVTFHAHIQKTVVRTASCKLNAPR